MSALSGFESSAAGVPRGPEHICSSQSISLSLLKGLFNCGHTQLKYLQVGAVMGRLSFQICGTCETRA